MSQTRIITISSIPLRMPSSSDHLSSGEGAKERMQSQPYFALNKYIYLYASLLKSSDNKF